MTPTSTLRTQRSGRDDAVLTITLNNPPVNALGRELRAELTRTFTEITKDRIRARVVILRGGNGRFSAGGDIAEMARRTGPADDYALHGSFDDLYESVSNCPIPVIALIERYAMGGGFELALRCDLRYATPDVKLAASAVKMGLVESAHTLPSEVSRGHAAEMLFSGDPVDGAQAAAIGFLTRVLPAGDLDRFVTDLAQRIANRPAESVRLTKQVLRAATAVPPGAAELAARNWLMLRAGSDHAEAVAAFRDHREPRFEAYRR